MRGPGRTGRQPRALCSTVKICELNSPCPPSSRPPPPAASSTTSSRTPPRTPPTWRCRSRAAIAWVDVTAQQFLAEVKAVAKGLVATGVEPGDRVGVMCRTRYEWTLVDYAIWYAGAVSVPIYETSSAEQVQWILCDSGAVAVFLESEKNKRTFDEVAVDIPAVTRVWVFDDGVLDQLKEDGQNVSDDELEARRAHARPPTARHDHLHVRHHRPAQGLHADPQQLHVRGRQRRVGHARRLPRARLLDPAVPAARARLRPRHPDRLHPRRRPARATPPTSRTCCRAWPSFQPTFLLAVPRVFEKIFNASQQKAVADGKGKIFDTRRTDGHRLQQGPRRGRRRPRAEAQARPVRQARLQQAARTPWAATCAGPCPAALRSAPGSATSSAASASRSSRATASPRPPRPRRSTGPARMRIGSVGPAPPGREGQDRRRRRGPARRRPDLPRLLEQPDGHRRGDRARRLVPLRRHRRDRRRRLPARSPAARRSCSSRPAARTWRRPCSRTGCARTGW